MILMNERANRMKNLFIIKKVTEDKDLTDEAFVVWCGLRNIMQMDVMEYFVSYNMLAYSIFGRVPNRYELTAIKNGLNELIDKGAIRVVDTYSKSEMVLDLCNLYYKKEDGFFSDLYCEEMHKIMNLNGNFDRYKLLRYFTCQIGTFNRSENMGKYKGKIGGMGLDYFLNLIPITKPTLVSFNKILEENELLFVIRHNDFFQGITFNGNSELREIPNTYSRWSDRELAKEYAENIHGYKYNEDIKDKKSQKANQNRSMGLKLHYLITQKKEYSEDEIKEIYAYVLEKNKRLKKEYDYNIQKGYHPDEPDYIDTLIFEQFPYLNEDSQDGNSETGDWEEPDAMDDLFTVEEILDMPTASDVVA